MQFQLSVVATNRMPPHAQSSVMCVAVWLCLCEQKLFFSLFWLAAKVFDAPIKTLQMRVPNEIFSHYPLQDVRKIHKEMFLKQT